MEASDYRYWVSGVSNDLAPTTEAQAVNPSQYLSHPANPCQAAVKCDPEARTGDGTKANGATDLSKCGEIKAVQAAERIKLDTGFPFTIDDGGKQPLRFECTSERECDRWIDKLKESQHPGLRESKILAQRLEASRKAAAMPESKQK